MEISVTRFGQVLRIKEGQLGKYSRLHAEVWPEVLRTIGECGIRNYSIFHKSGWLFAYFEYHGDDYAADSKKMAACPHTQKWWAIMEPMQEPVEFRDDGEWWSSMNEVFHSE